MTSLAFLVIRLAVGGLLAGHGAQKLFGWFGGSGPEGTSAFMASLKMQPAKEWAVTAGVSEFLGGVLTALGLLNPIGPMLAIASMATASLTAHKGRPIWGQKGGAELPVTNIAALTALVLAGPGKVSLDTAFGTRVPWWFSFLVLGGVAAGVAAAVGPEPIALPARTDSAADVPMPPAPKHPEFPSARDRTEREEADATR